MAANVWPSEVKGHARFTSAPSNRTGGRARGLSFGVSLVLHVAVLLSLLLVKTQRVDVPFGGALKGDMVLVELTSGKRASTASADRPSKTTRKTVPPKPLVGDTAIATEREQPVAAPNPQTVAPEGSKDTRFGLADGVATAGPLGRADGHQASERQRYIYELQRYIESRKLYPSLSQRLRETGQVKVGFSIQKDGSVTNVSVTGPCGFERLNEAARNLVQGMERFKPLPPSLESESLALEIPIEYVLR